MYCSHASILVSNPVIQCFTPPPWLFQVKRWCHYTFQRKRQYFFLSTAHAFVTYASPQVVNTALRVLASLLHSLSACEVCEHRTSDGYCGRKQGTAALVNSYPAIDIYIYIYIGQLFHNYSSTVVSTLVAKVFFHADVQFLATADLVE